MPRPRESNWLSLLKKYFESLFCVPRPKASNWLSLLKKYFESLFCVPRPRVGYYIARYFSGRKATLKNLSPLEEKEAVLFLAQHNNKKTLEGFFVIVPRPRVELGTYPSSGERSTN